MECLGYSRSVLGAMSNAIEIVRTENKITLKQICQISLFKPLRSDFPFVYDFYL